MNTATNIQISSTQESNVSTQLNVLDTEVGVSALETEDYLTPEDKNQENNIKPRSMPSASQTINNTKDSTLLSNNHHRKKFDSKSSQEVVKESQEWQMNRSPTPSPENGNKSSNKTEAHHSPQAVKLNQSHNEFHRTPSPVPSLSGKQYHHHHHQRHDSSDCATGMSAYVNGSENGSPRDSVASRAHSPATGSGNSSLDSGSSHVATPPTTLTNGQDNLGSLSIPDNVSRSSESGRSYDSLYYQKTPDTPLKPDVSSVKSSKSGDKKKKPSAWYNMLNPTYKSRSDDFKRLFKDLPESERLIVDYSCAMQKDILVHGRLYVSQNYICFYANIFRWETFLVLRCRDIASMTKEKTAIVINNAIQICTSNEKHFFTSFGARDKTYLMLFRVWQNALLEQPMSSQQLWTWVHISYGDELGLTSDDDDYVCPNPLPLGSSVTEDDKSFHCSDDQSFIDKEGLLLSDKLDFRVGRGHPIGMYDSTLDLVNGLNDSPILPPKMSKNPKDGPPPKATSVSDYPPTDLSDTTESDLAIDGGEIICGCESHQGKEVLNATFEIAVDQLFNLIFTKSKFMLDLMDSRKTFDVMEIPWQLSTETNHKMRQLTYTLTLNHSMAKTAQTTDTQRLMKQSKPGQLYVVDCEIVNTGIPYSDTFSVKSQYCITKISKNETRLRVHGSVQYKKSVWGLVKSLIEKTAMQGLNEFCVDLEVALRRDAEGIVQPSGKKIRRRKRTKTIDLKDVPKEMAKAIQSQTISRKSIPAIIGNEAVSAGPTSDLVIRVILATLVTLLLLNGLLFYKLWSLEDQSLQLATLPADFELPLDGNPSSESLIRLLRQQEILHRSEIEKWKDAVGDVIKLIRLMENSLSDLKNNIESYGNSAMLKSVTLVSPNPVNPTNSPPPTVLQQNKE